MADSLVDDCGPIISAILGVLIGFINDQDGIDIPVANSSDAIFNQTVYGFVSSAPSSVSIANNVSYSCVLTNQWTEARHPAQYPSAWKWSEPIMVAHNQNYAMWADGTAATDGVKDVAETGSRGRLRFFEIPIGTDAGKPSIGSDQTTTAQTLPDLAVSAEYPLITGITGLDPSPDWFTGFPGLNASDENGMWLQFFSIETYAWDAGTEAGITYNSTNAEENVAISRMTEVTSPAVDNGIFLSPDNSTVLPVMQWQCSLN